MVTSFLVVVQLFSFWATSAKSLALSDAYTTLARGTDAARFNPANLALKDRPRFSFRLIGIDGTLLNNGISVSLYNRYVGADLDSIDKNNIVNSISKDGLGFLANTGLGVIEFAAGPFALSIRGVGGIQTTLPREIFELVLFGNELGRTYNFGTLDAEGVSYASATASYGMPLTLAGYESGIGMGFRYIQGFFIVRPESLSANLLTTEEAIIGNGNIVYRMATGGRGFGFDIGFVNKPAEKWTIGMALLNLFSSINWNKGSKEGWAEFKIDSLNIQRIDREDIVASDSDLRSIESFKSQLPFYLRLGGSYEFSEDLRIALDYTQASANSPFSSKRPRFSFGLEYTRLSWLSLRSGLSFGGKEGSTFSCGMGHNIGGFGGNLGFQYTGGIFTGAKGLKMGIDIGYKP